MRWFCEVAMECMLMEVKLLSARVEQIRAPAGCLGVEFVGSYATKHVVKSSHEGPGI